SSSASALPINLKSRPKSRLISFASKTLRTLGGRGHTVPLQSDLMASPRTFSVGIPPFNQADYLEETILSLLNQTRPPDEIVISDHYSTDDTPEIIEKYAGHVRGVKPPRGAN